MFGYESYLTCNVTLSDYVEFSQKTLKLNDYSDPLSTISIMASLQSPPSQDRVSLLVAPCENAIPCFTIHFHI